MIQNFSRWKRRSRADAEPQARGALQFPIPAPARVAILDHGFLPDRNAREFSGAEREAIEQWGPEAIVAPLETALSLADQKLQGLTELATLNAAMVVLTALDGEPLEDHHRELLWRAFGVPVFEQLRSPEGAVLARECEVHDGLHLAPGAKIPAELSTAVTADHCECGSEAPRLRGHLSTRLPNALGT